MKLKPMADNVLLKQHEAQETTASGIILATTSKEKPAIYEVVSVGPGTKDVTMTVSVGDKVVVGKFVGTDVTLDKVEYKFVKLFYCIAGLGTTYIIVIQRKQITDYATGIIHLSSPLILNLAR